MCWISEREDVDEDTVNAARLTAFGFRAHAVNGGRVIMAGGPRLGVMPLDVAAC